MIYNVANTVEIGRPVERVVDANGLEYDFPIEVDTETGRIEQFAKNEHGKVFVDNETGEVSTETVFAAAPVLVLFKGSE